MRSDYILYPEAIEKLESTGILAKVREAEDKFQVRGVIFDDEIIGVVRDMKEEGWFNHMPLEERDKFSQAMNKAYKERDSAAWKVVKDGKEYTEKVEPEDFLIMLGDDAREILPKKDIFNYRKFGFDNVCAFTGAVGAAIANTRYKFMRDGYIWETKRPNGRLIRSHITGSDHCDLRIYQTDLTPYDTTDFLGNKVSFRPEMESDGMTVSAYHSTEGNFLVGALKYIHQLGLRPAILENRANSFIQEMKSLGQGGGTCAEHFGGFDQSPMLFFTGYGIPLPVLDMNFKTHDRSVDGLVVEGRQDGCYVMFAGPQRELVLSYEEKTDCGVSDPSRAVNFIPEEIDHVIRGIFMQAARGRGRTSVKQLIDILEYRLSPDFGKEIEGVRRRR